MKALTTLLAILVLNACCLGQGILKCGTLDEPRPEIEALISNMQPVAQAFRGGGGGCDEMLFIPVVFHVIADPNVPASNIQDPFIIAQLARLLIRPIYVTGSGGIPDALFLEPRYDQQGASLDRPEELDRYCFELPLPASGSMSSHSALEL
jgi:hypothetical protein